MDPRIRIAIVVALLAAGGGIGLVITAGDERAPADDFDQAEQPSIPLPEVCLDLPEEREPLPDWYPSNLPLPDGSYPIEVPDQRAEGIHEIYWSVNASLDDFVAFVLDHWEDAGWNLGRGEREPGEAESVFFTPDAERYGQFRARMVYCDQDWTEVQLVMVLDGEAPAQPLIPSPSPS